MSFPGVCDIECRSGSGSSSSSVQRSAAKLNSLAGRFTFRSQACVGHQRAAGACCRPPAPQVNRIARWRPIASVSAIRPALQRDQQEQASRPTSFADFHEFTTRRATHSPGSLCGRADNDGDGDFMESVITRGACGSAPRSIETLYLAAAAAAAVAPP